MPPTDRVLLVAVCWRANLTMRQIGPLFGVAHAAAHGVIDTVDRCWRRLVVPGRDQGAVHDCDGVDRIGIAHLHNITLTG